MPRPDALMMPAMPAATGNVIERGVAVCRVFEALLECDYVGGERAWFRKQPHGRVFVTRDPADTINFPIDHPKSGQPRYRWERRDGGVQVGYLIEEPNARREDSPQAGV
jgi:hypothetical protein